MRVLYREIHFCYPQDAVQKWGTAEAEFSALQGAQVVEIAAALKAFEDELVM